jgi:hypothetical protein
LRISQLEQEVRELQRLVQQQTNRINSLEYSLRQSRVTITASPERAIATETSGSKEGASLAWQNGVRWDRLKTGMTEDEVIRILSAPTSARAASDGSRILFYSVELEAGGFLSGQVILRERKVVEVQRPTLK